MPHTIRTVVDPPDATVTITGELDVLAEPRVEQALDAAVLRGARRVVVDLAGVTFVDAAALGVLCSQRARLREAGGDLGVLSATDAFGRLCRAAGIEDGFALAA